MGQTDSFWRRTTARLLCVVLFTASIASTAHTSGDRDADCTVVVTAHDASAHSIGGAPLLPDEHPLHCLACHWARSFRPCAETGYLDAPVNDAGVRLLVEALPLTPASIAAQPTLRSPPA